MAIQLGVRRVLIADDVGLGKTIQAGIVVAETLRRHPPARVLIAVPASLTDQWAAELMRRFRIEAVAADRAGLDRFSGEGAPGDSPWNRGGVWIASLDFLKQPHVLASLPPRLWDLVVIDEVHTACGDSARYDACETIAGAARTIVLLTATPHDGDAARFERLLAIGALPGEADRMEVFRRSRRDLDLARPRRVRWQRVRLSEPELRAFEALAAFERAVVRAAGVSKRDAALLLLSVFRKRALSTMSALAISLRRRLDWLEGRRPADDRARQGVLAFDDGDDLGHGESAALAGDVGFDPKRERAWLKRVIVLAEAARRIESKASRVAAFAARVREPIVVFTEFRDSLEVLRRRLETRRSIACLHGGQAAPERQHELARFSSGDASVLLATDVASLGLNLQARARAVVNLELPWNPMRLEQRAGRVDRIGQARSVHVTLLVGDDDVEAPVLKRLATRVLIARRALGDDALQSWVPDGAEIRQSVLLGSAAPPATPPRASWPRGRRWRRSSRLAAAALARHRALRTYWRAPDGHPRAPRWTTAAKLPAIRGVAGSALFVFVVPLVDASGAIVESHVVAVRADSDSIDFDDAIACAAAAARLSLGTRARRLGQRRHAHLAELIAREQVLAARLELGRHPSEAQPGLFDRRAIRSIEASDADVSAIREDTRRRVADLESGTSIEIGDPIVTLMVTAR
jgi:superfamily II DNA or RNA helicase